MRAAIIGIVHHEHVARADLAGVLAQDRADRVGHRAQMHRHMWRVSHQITRCIKDRAGEIVALLNVHRIGGVGECCTHLISDGHKEVVKHLQHDRIDRSTDRLFPVQGLHPPQNQPATWQCFGLPVSFDSVSARRLDDYGGTIYSLAHTDSAALDQRYIPPCPFCEHPRRHGLCGAAFGQGIGCAFFGRAHSLGGQQVDNQLIVFRHKAEALLVCGIEPAAHLGFGIKWDWQGLMRARGADMGCFNHGDPICANALPKDFGTRVLADPVQYGTRQHLVGQRRGELVFADRADVG